MILFSSETSQEKYYSEKYHKARDEYFEFMSKTQQSINDLCELIVLNLDKIKYKHHRFLFHKLNSIIHSLMLPQDLEHMSDDFNNKLEYFGDYPCIDALLSKMTDLFRISFTLLKLAQIHTQPQIYDDLYYRFSKTSKQVAELKDYVLKATVSVDDSS